MWLDDAPVTQGPHDGNPVWSPDGRFLAFTGRRGEKEGDSTLHVTPVDAPGELRTVCTMPDGLGDVTWSPDGRWLAFISRTRDDRYEAEDVAGRRPARSTGSSPGSTARTGCSTGPSTSTSSRPTAPTPPATSHPASSSTAASWLADSTA